MVMATSKLKLLLVTFVIKGIPTKNFCHITSRRDTALAKLQNAIFATWLLKKKRYLRWHMKSDHFNLISETNKSMVDTHDIDNDKDQSLMTTAQVMTTPKTPQLDTLAKEKCDICSQMFLLKSHLKVHMERMHDQKENSNDISVNDNDNDNDQTGNNDKLYSLKDHLNRSNPKTDDDDMSTNHVTTVTPTMTDDSFSDMTQTEELSRDANELDSIKRWVKSVTITKKEFELAELWRKELLKLDDNSHKNVTCDRVTLQENHDKSVTKTAKKRKRSSLGDRKSFGFNRHACECDICGEKLDSNLAFISHKKEIHGDNQPFKCEFCNKGFAQKGNKKTHISKYHNK